MVLLATGVVPCVRQQLDRPQALEQWDAERLGVPQQVCQLYLLVAVPQVLTQQGAVLLVLAPHLRRPWRQALALQV